jgi:hypothetical protein
MDDLHTGNSRLTNRGPVQGEDGILWCWQLMAICEQAQIAEASLHMNGLNKIKIKVRRTLVLAGLLHEVTPIAIRDHSGLLCGSRDEGRHSRVVMCDQLDRHHSCCRN